MVLAAPNASPPRVRHCLQPRAPADGIWQELLTHWSCSLAKTFQIPSSPNEFRKPALTYSLMPPGAAPEKQTLTGGSCCSRNVLERAQFLWKERAQCVKKM
jgi:hypothetical protein